MLINRLEERDRVGPIGDLARHCVWGHKPQAAAIICPP